MEIRKAGANLLLSLLVRLATRPISGQRTDLVHLRERLLRLRCLLVVSLHYDNKFLPKLRDCKRRVLLLGLVSTLRNSDLPRASFACIRSLLDERT